MKLNVFKIIAAVVLVSSNFQAQTSVIQKIETILNLRSLMQNLQ
jgi:hypothetical protein